MRPPVRTKRKNIQGVVRIFVYMHKLLIGLLIIFFKHSQLCPYEEGLSTFLHVRVGLNLCWCDANLLKAEPMNVCNQLEH